MRTITIADASGTPGYQVDIEETIEEAVTWAENEGLTVTDTGEGVVYVSQIVDERGWCDPHTEHFEGMLKEMSES